MKYPKMAAPLLAGALLLGGVAACSEDSGPSEEIEDVSPELDSGEGEDGVGDEEPE